MTGRLLLGGPTGKHTHAILTLDEGVLMFEDSRQFGCFQFSERIPGARRPAGARTAGDFACRLQRRPEAPQDTRQGPAAEPAFLARRGKYLRGRGAVSRRHSSAGHRQPFARRAPAEAVRRPAGGAARGHRRGWFVHFRLRGCPGPQRILSVQPPRLPADRRALCTLRYSHPAAAGNAKIFTFLPEMPEALATMAMKPMRYVPRRMI